MPVGRMILKSISDSKKLSKVKTDTARLLYTWLIPHLNVNGCYHADPTVIRNKILTRLDTPLKLVEECLDDLENNDLIIRYQTNGDIFLIVPDFVEKQPKLNRLREATPTIKLPTPEQLKKNNIDSIPEQLVKDIDIAKESKVNVISLPEEQLPVTEDDKNNIKEIFEHWNLSEIVIHRALTNPMKTSIKARLNNYSKEEIMEAIGNYKKIIDDITTYWTHRFTLQDFLSRGEGKYIDVFLDLEKAKDNFKKDKQGNNQGGVRVYE